MVLESENNFDFKVIHFLKGIESPFLTGFMKGITFFGSSYFLLPAYLLTILYFLFYKKNQRLAIDIAAIGITSIILLFSLKRFFHRPRPVGALIDNVSGFSFPSGHSFSSFTFFGMIIYLLLIQKPVNRPLVILLSLLIFFVAVSRIYLNVHYASDVIAGFVLCITWLTLSFGIIRKLRD